MKPRYCLVSLMLVVSLLYLATIGCSRSDICRKPTSPDYYHIRFALHGPVVDQQDIILNYDRDGDPDPTLTWFKGLGWMEMGGAYCGDSASPSFDLWARQWGSPGALIPIQESALTIIESETTYDYAIIGGAFTFTTIGDVGGDVEGTFNVTYARTPAAPSLGSPLTAVGEFRLLRTADQ